MISVTFDKPEGITLLRWMNYLFASLTDFELLRDEHEKAIADNNADAINETQKALDSAELAFRRAIDEVQKITPTETITIVNKLEDFRMALIKDGESEADNIDVIEVGTAEEAIA